MRLLGLCVLLLVAQFAWAATVDIPEGTTTGVVCPANGTTITDVFTGTGTLKLTAPINTNLYEQGWYSFTIDTVAPLAAFAGQFDVAQGVVTVGSDNPAIAAKPWSNTVKGIDIAAGAKLNLENWANLVGNWWEGPFPITSDIVYELGAVTLTGKGTLMSIGLSTNNDRFWTPSTSNIRVDGGIVAPGDHGIGAGKLSIFGPLTFGNTNGRSKIKIDIVDVTKAAGEGYDQLAMCAGNADQWGSGDTTGYRVEGGKFNNPQNADLVINVDPGQNVLGKVFTVVTTFQDMTDTATHLNSVTFTGLPAGVVGHYTYVGGPAARPYKAGLPYTGGEEDAASAWQEVGPWGAVQVTFTSIPGDADCNGLVDQNDYKIWYDNYGTGTTVDLGNFKGYGIVDQDDYKIWYDNYGVKGGAVPEPATLALLAMGGLGLLRRKK